MSLKKNKTTLSEICLEILRKTNDGDDLSPGHLKLVENACNGFLDGNGVSALRDLHEKVTEGDYEPGGFCGHKDLRIDHEGYIYYKGIQVEHFSRSLKNQSDPDTQKAARELVDHCNKLEELSIKVNGTTAGFYRRDFERAIRAKEQGYIEDFLPHVEGFVYKAFLRYGEEYFKEFEDHWERIQRSA